MSDSDQILKEEKQEEQKEEQENSLFISETDNPHFLDKRRGKLKYFLTTGKLDGKRVRVRFRQ